LRFTGRICLLGAGAWGRMEHHSCRCDEKEGKPKQAAERCLHRRFLLAPGGRLAPQAATLEGEVGDSASPTLNPPHAESAR